MSLDRWRGLEDLRLIIIQIQRDYSSILKNYSQIKNRFFNYFEKKRVSGVPIKLNRERFKTIFKRKDYCRLK